MSALADFLSMGGYAFYVWGSYIVTFGLMGLEIITLRRRKKTLLRRRAPPGRLHLKEKT